MEVCDDVAQVGAIAEDLATLLQTVENAAAKASLACHTGPPQLQRSALLSVAGVLVCLHPASRGIIDSILFPPPCSPPPPLGPGLGGGTH